MPGGFGRDYNRRRKAEGAMANAVGISETNVEKRASRQEGEGEGEGEGGKEEGKESVGSWIDTTYESNVYSTLLSVDTRYVESPSNILDLVC